MTTTRTQTSTTRTRQTNNEVRAMTPEQDRVGEIHCVRRSSSFVRISLVCPPPAVSMMGDSR